MGLLLLTETGAMGVATRLFTLNVKSTIGGSSGGSVETTTLTSVHETNKNREVRGSPVKNTGAKQLSLFKGDDKFIVCTRRLATGGCRAIGNGLVESVNVIVPVTVSVSNDGKGISGFSVENPSK